MAVSTTRVKRFSILTSLTKTWPNCHSIAITFLGSRICFTVVAFIIWIFRKQCWFAVDWGAPLEIEKVTFQKPLWHCRSLRTRFIKYDKLPDYLVDPFHDQLDKHLGCLSRPQLSQVLLEANKWKIYIRKN